jgi:CoA:oxalate CoA-transferase
MLPLTGIRILDFSQGHGAAAASMQLLDFGAEVIKVENSKSGDYSRNWEPMVNGQSTYFSMLNKGKKSIAVNLKHKEGIDLIKQLVKDVDIVLANFKSKTMEKYGLGYETLSELNKEIIYVEVTGFGNDSKFSKYPAYEINVQAASGILDVTGFEDGPPMKIGVNVASYFTANYVSIAVNMALITREKLNEGQKIEISMTDAMFSGLEDKLAHYSVANAMPKRVGNAHPMIAPYDSFKTKDGFVAFGVSTDSQWESFCRAIGKEEWFMVEKYKSNESRGNHYFGDLRVLIEEYTLSKTCEEILEVLSGVVPAGKVNTVDEITKHPQIEAREMLIQCETECGDIITIPGMPIKFHGKDNVTLKKAPSLGQHTYEVLKTVGYNDEKIMKLVEEHTIKLYT